MKSINTNLFAIVAVLATAFAILFHAPGSLSPDSTSQLLQARTSIYTDSHPPIMAMLWHLMDKVSPGPLGMLVLHIGAFATALYILCNLFSAVPQIVKAAAFLLALFWPGAFFILGAIWKDIGFVAAFLLALALIGNPLRTRAALRTDWMLAVLVVILLFYSINVRFNSGPAVVPLIVLMIWQWSTRAPVRRFLESVLAGGVAGLVLFALGLSMSAVVVKTKANFWQTLAVYDLVGISAKLDRDLLPHDLYPNSSIAEIKTHYTPRSLNPLTQTSHAFSDLGETAQLAKLRSRWFSMILRHPIAYLQHRAAIMRQVLGMTVNEPYVAVYLDSTGSAELGLGPMKTPWRDKIKSKVQAWAVSSPMFRPYWYLCVGLLLAVVAFFSRARTSAIAIALFASSIGNVAGLFVTAPSSDYRYSLVVIVNTTVMAMLLLLEIASRVSLPKRRPVETRSEALQATPRRDVVSEGAT